MMCSARDISTQYTKFQINALQPHNRFNGFIFRIWEEGSSSILQNPKTVRKIVRNSWTKWNRPILNFSDHENYLFPLIIMPRMGMRRQMQSLAKIYSRISSENLYRENWIWLYSKSYIVINMTITIYVIKLTRWRGHSIYVRRWWYYWFSISIILQLWY